MPILPDKRVMSAEALTHRIELHLSSARMFENNFLEACSKVHPSVPFIFYIPLTLGFCAWSLYGGKTSLGTSALFAAEQQQVRHLRQPHLGATLLHCSRLIRLYRKSKALSTGYFDPSQCRTLLWPRIN